MPALLPLGLLPKQYCIRAFAAFSWSLIARHIEYWALIQNCVRTAAFQKTVIRVHKVKLDDVILNAGVYR